MAAFRQMHVSPAQHSYAWLSIKCDYRIDTQTDGRTDRRRTKWSLFAAMLHRRHKKVIKIWSWIYQWWDVVCMIRRFYCLNRDEIGENAIYPVLRIFRFSTSVKIFIRMLKITQKLKRTRQIIRYRAKATLQRPLIRQYTSSNEWATKPKGWSYNSDKVWNGAPDGGFGNFFLLRNANKFDKFSNSIYFK